MAERTSVGPRDTYADLNYNPEVTDRLEDEYTNAFAETSPNGKYTICCIDECATVTLFENGDLVYEKSLVGQYDMAVADNGVAVVSGFTEGGYQDGDHYLFVWNSNGEELFTEELRATTDSIHINQAGEYAVIHTEQVLKKFDENTPWDFSVYILDINAGEFRARYTDQIPGIEPPGPRREQISRIDFVETDNATYIALYGRGTSDVEPDITNIQEVPTDVTLIDLDGTMVQPGIPYIDRYPDHYALSDEAKERLKSMDAADGALPDDVAMSDEDEASDSGAGGDSRSTASLTDLEEHIDRIQSWSQSDQEDTTTFRLTPDDGIRVSISDIEEDIESVRDTLDENSPSLKKYPDISQTLFEISIKTARNDPRQTTDPSRLFEAWYSQHPQATVEAESVEKALDRLEAMGPEVADLTEEYYRKSNSDDPDADYVEVMQKTEQVQADLDELYYGAQALGRLISTCVSEHGTIVVSFVSTGLDFLETWADEKDPDSYDGPSGNAGLRKASASILKALAEHNPEGLADELYEHREMLYELCPAPSDADTTTPGNESKAIAGTVLRLALPLSSKYPEALGPILPSLVDNAGRDYVFLALQNVSRNSPAELLNAFDSLIAATERGRDFEPATGEVDYPDVVARLLQNAASEAPEAFWKAVDDWITGENPPNPRVLRAMLDPVADQITDDSVLGSSGKALQTIVNHPDWQIRRIAVELLRETDNPESENLLEELASDPIPEVSDAAQDAIGDQG